METLKTINSRKSVRSYTGAVSEEALQKVLLAGQAAPVGMGKYETIHFTVIRNQDLLTELDRNGAAFFGNPEATPLYGAPCLIVVSTPIPDPAKGNVAYSNAAIIAQNMHLAATDLGLGSCLIWGAIVGLNANPELVAKLGLPEGFTPCCAITLGETAETFEEKTIPADRIATDYID